MIPALRNAVDLTLDTVQSTLCHVDGALFKQAITSNRYGSGDQTRAMELTLDFMRVHHNMTFAMPLSLPHTVHRFHHQARGCANVRQVAPLGHVDRRVEG